MLPILAPGTLLRELRVRSGLTISGAASAAAIPKSSLSEWERGLHKPPVQALSRLADAYRANAADRAKLLGPNAGGLDWRAMRLPGSPEMKPLLADALRGLRLRGRLSQSELARRMDVSQAALSNWEAGDAAPSDSNLQRLGEILCLQSEEAAVLSQCQAGSLPVWMTISLGSTPIPVGDVFPGRDLDEFGETLSLLCATHAAQRRAILDRRWMDSYVEFADRYCGALMRADRNRELADLSRHAIRFAKGESNSAAYHRLHVMNVLARHRIWDSLPHRVADGLVRVSGGFHPSVVGWGYGTAMAIYSENRLPCRVEMCFQHTRPRPFDSDGTIATGIYINATSQIRVGQPRAALDLVEELWDDYLRLRKVGDPYEIFPFVAAAKCHLALGEKADAETYLDHADATLAGWDSPTQPGATSSMQRRIAAVRAELHK